MQRHAAQGRLPRFQLLHHPHSAEGKLRLRGGAQCSRPACTPPSRMCPVPPGHTLRHWAAHCTLVFAAQGPQEERHLAWPPGSLGTRSSSWVG